MKPDLSQMFSPRVEISDSFEWATVTQVDPLRVRLDGDPAELDGSPDVLVPLVQGQRCWVQRHGKYLLVVGAKPLPPAASPVPDQIVGAGLLSLGSGWALQNAADCHAVRSVGGMVAWQLFVKNTSSFMGLSTAGILQAPYASTMAADIPVTVGVMQNATGGVVYPRVSARLFAGGRIDVWAETSIPAGTQWRLGGAHWAGA